MVKSGRNQVPLCLSIELQLKTPHTISSIVLMLGIQEEWPTLTDNSFCGSFVAFRKLLNGINIDILYHLHVLSTLFLAT